MPAFAPAPSPLAVTLRIAARDLRAGLRGFGIFLACLALGVGAITGVGSLASSLVGGIAREGRTILGGDIAVSLVHREASGEERAALERLGRVSAIATMRAMARRADGATALVELKGVDEAYPTLGRLDTDPLLPRERLFAAESGQGNALFGAVADPALLARLEIKAGDVIEVGEGRLRITAALASEPDKVAAGIGFGPRLMVSLEGLRASGLVQPGSLVRHVYRVALPEGASDAEVERAVAALQAAAPEAGWEVRTRMNAAPQVARNIDRFTQFLALVGLTALVVGGVGVANAVRAFVDRKRATIATLKSLGATGGRVLAILLTEVMGLAALGVAIGLAVGAALPFLVSALFGHILPVPLEPAVHPRDLALGALYGFMTALAFALWPLGRARDVPVSALFRDRVEPEARRPRLGTVLMVGAAGAGLVAVAILFAWDRRVAMIAVAAIGCAFVLLRLVASGVMAIAARLPRPRRTELRLALANIHRPGSLTPSLILSLGLGVALLVALGQIDVNLSRELSRSLPERAPSFFFVDIQNADAARFDAFLREQAAEGARIERVPMMRGRLVSLNGVRAEDVRASEQAAWVLEGDRGITYSPTLPEGSRLTEGEWWAPDHTGPNLVSFDAEIGRGLGLRVGDTVVVNVLGRNIETRVANLRSVEWRSLGINFVMVFSPNTFAGAPHTHLATLAYPGSAAGSTLQQDAALLRATAAAFPAVTAVRVKDALEAVNKIVAQLGAAIRGASSVALVSSLLVLAGALAAGHRARLYDAVLLKTLGATRPRILAAFCLEYGMLGLAAALFGAVAGALAAWAIVAFVMRFAFELQPLGLAASALLAIVVTITLGLLGTWRILGEKAAPRLRNL